jgi:hypothetical protein
MRWFTPPEYELPAPARPDRYEGKPLLIILEYYVLSSIDRLTPDKEADLRTLTQQIYGGGSNWRATLRTTLQLLDSMDRELRQMWRTHQDLAWEARVNLVPGDFARIVVDQNFAHLIAMR